MGTLKSTLKLESTDLFPTPVNFTVVNNNTVAGTFSGFNNVVVSNTAQNLNLAAIGVTGAYVYLQSPAANGTAIYCNVGTVTPTTSALRLEPGDVAFLPVGDSAAGVAAFSAITTGGTASLNYFVGDRG
jgi:hypothetical protein